MQGTTRFRFRHGGAKRKWILTAGLGGMGGAQPLAGVFAGASVLAVDVVYINS